MQKLNVLYENSEVLVIDKPSGITVNRSETTINEATIQDLIEKEYEIEKEESDFSKRSGIVHRLDKETSGVLIVAKNQDAFQNLQKQFKDRLIEKKYIALSHGKVIPEEGEIKATVGRLPWNRKRFGVLAGGRESETEYKVIKYIERKTLRGNFLSLLELFPKTGRTHQIRVHLQYINHPIFGDFLYSGRKTSREDRRLLERVFLHASKISFFHPKTNKKITIESPLPKELEEVLQELAE